MGSQLICPTHRDPALVIRFCWIEGGRNDLEIEVANLWPNRLIGDAARPEDQRFTWTIVGHGHKADSKLLRSGLLGPVRILISE